MKFVLATFVVSFFLIAPVAFGQQMGAGKLTEDDSLSLTDFITAAMSRFQSSVLDAIAES